MRVTPLTFSLMAVLGSLVSLPSRAAESAPSTAKKQFVITDYGAIPGGKTLDTKAIQTTIDAAYSSGGGVVTVPKGVFRTGSIFLKQGVDLYMSEGAVLLGSNNIEDYPMRRTRIEGHFQQWRMAMINAQGVKNLHIYGKGTFDGNGILFWAAFWQRRKENPDCTNLEVQRPRLMYIDRCQGVKIDNVSLQDSGFWNIHLYDCQNVDINGVSIYSPATIPIRAPSTDGIDVDSCQHVTIQNSTISTGDDCIALKGSKGPLANEDKSSPPVEHILVENCHFKDGDGVVTFGSEATVIRDVVVRNCIVNGDNRLVRLKLRPDTPQLYENIVYENIKMDGTGPVIEVKPWTQFYDVGDHKPPPSVVRNLTIRNVTGTFGSFGILKGNPGDTIDGVTMENVHLKLKDPKLVRGDVKNLKAEDVTVNGSPVHFGKVTAAN